ncbi:DUF808 domain-containing protein [Vibrio salinus]|uniref:DUF808 domain-containing protein n=1 Tax=Vibrio salinus TaxID=2899784 RepID=UPI001E6352BF|nr:DUF808 domain-containing protein [Vibrio salinus]MCE0495048.1 DUF808 domain-containing protein [Vibrio salinus]
MAGASLLTLLDDIAVLTKIAAKKTAGVLGDDLALNAQQVTGMAAERELPVIWAVAKGSLRNKAILVPLALLFSTFLPWVIIPLLMIGGLYLCFEGAEKVFDSFLAVANVQSSETVAETDDTSDDEVENQKIQGAIRTDFILSAEIIVIALGTVQHQPVLNQIVVLSVVAVVMTAGVYGIVAGIVKLDDLGFFLEKYSEGKGFFHYTGQQLMTLAPKLMSVLTVVGTAAMFLVGGGMVVEHTPVLRHVTESVLSDVPGYFDYTLSYVLRGVFGVIAGLILALLASLVKRYRS